MKKRAHLYIIAAVPALADVIPISAASTPRERSWRDLLRRLEKNPPSGAAATRQAELPAFKRAPHVNAIAKEES